jgi:hypothetical protein
MAQVELLPSKCRYCIQIPELAKYPFPQQQKIIYYRYSFLLFISGTCHALVTFRITTMEFRKLKVSYTCFSVHSGTCQHDKF